MSPPDFRIETAMNERLNGRVYQGMGAASRFQRPLTPQKGKLLRDHD